MDIYTCLFFLTELDDCSTVVNEYFSDAVNGKISVCLAARVRVRGVSRELFDL